MDLQMHAAVPGSVAKAMHVVVLPCHRAMVVVNVVESAKETLLSMEEMFSDLLFLNIHLTERKNQKEKGCILLYWDR